MLQGVQLSRDPSRFQIQLRLRAPGFELLFEIRPSAVAMVAMLIGSFVPAFTGMEGMSTLTTQQLSCPADLGGVQCVGIEIFLGLGVCGRP